METKPAELKLQTSQSFKNTLNRAVIESQKQENDSNSQSSCSSFSFDAKEDRNLRLLQATKAKNAEEALLKKSCQNMMKTIKD